MSNKTEADSKKKLSFTIPAPADEDSSGAISSEFKVRRSIFQRRIGSIAYQDGREDALRRIVISGKYEGHSLGVFTSGGDAQGMNSALRAIARMGIYLGCKVYFIHEGYEGMVDGSDSKFTLAQWWDVSGIIGLGGTIIGSARSIRFRTREGRLLAARNLIKRGISNLVCIGGDGSLTGAYTFREEWPSLIAELLSNNEINKDEAVECKCLKIVGLVGSIDNDFCGTDMTIGADSALHRIFEAMNAISTTGSSHMRCFVLEVMGRRCGYLALMTAIGSDADWLFIPEAPAAENWQEAMCSKLQLTRQMGQRLNVIIVAEGATDYKGQSITSNMVKDIVVERCGFDTRVTVLGHVQRGGDISAFDRILATRMGAEAVIALMESSDESAPVIISLAGNQAVRVPLTVCVQKTQAAAKAMDDRDYERAVALRGHTFKRNLNTYFELSKLHPKLAAAPPKHVFRIAIMNIGAPACGVNAAVRSVVRHVLCRGHKILMIFDGWFGFVKGTVQEAEWMTVNGWSGEGGSKLGTQKMDAKMAGFTAIAENIKKFKIDGLIIVGGFEGYLSVIQLYENRSLFPEFCIPILLIPATISNNIPGTDFSLGTDTALNEIIVTCDKMKQSAQGSKRRVFIVETMGGHCGYLATIAGLACGADQAYIYEEPYSIFDIVDDADHMKRKMCSEMKRGIILRNELSNTNFNTDFILRLFQEHGRGTFSARANVLGHAQQGGAPSPFDRSFAFRLGARAANGVLEMLEHNQVDTGRASVTDPASCGVVGLSKRVIDVSPIETLKDHTDFNKRLSMDPWWLKLRPLLRILAKHESVYVADINEAG